MMSKWTIVSLAVIACGVGLWAWWMPSGRARHAPAIASKSPPATDFTKAAHQKDGASAQRYLNNMTGEEDSAKRSAPESGQDIRLWTKRILAYAEERHLDNPNPDQLHSLARKTADLFQLLKRADQRQKEGEEPYTPLSGFITMAAVMALDKEFQATLQTTFSDFLYAQDEELIKGFF
jgi:hypothetical protein